MRSRGALRHELSEARADLALARERITELEWALARVDLVEVFNLRRLPRMLGRRSWRSGERWGRPDEGHVSPETYERMKAVVTDVA